MNLLAVIPKEPALYLILCAGVAMYIASKAAVDAIVGRGPATPGRLAIGQWIPIAALSVFAMLSNRPQIAVGLVFSTSVACLSLAAGSTVFLSPPVGSTESRRIWAMLVPAGLLAFLAGFHGQISVFDSLVLALEGVAVLLLWNDRPAKSNEPLAVQESVAPYPIWPRIVQLLLGIALAGVGAWLAVHGVDLAASRTDLVSAGLMSATILSPLLVLPVIGTGSEMAQKVQTTEAISSHVGLTLLNVFALLPLLGVLAHWQKEIWLAQNWLQSNGHQLIVHLHATWTSAPQVDLVTNIVAATPTPDFPHALIFPLAVWRVDVVMLIALGLFLLPVAIGRWSLTKLHGMAMMLGYVVYVILSLALVAMREI